MIRFFKRALWASMVALSIAAVGGCLFVVNGLWLAHGETPLSGQASPASHGQAPFEGETITIMAYNIAKGFIHRGGLIFAPRAEVLERMGRMAALIRATKPDLLFLSEAVLECSACPGNQVALLAEESGMPFWIFGENYCFGLPFFRIVGGNAILSRWPLEAVGNPSLPGRRAFFITRNNRRILMAAIVIQGKKILLGSVHNDSFDLANNLDQTRWILEDLGDRPAVLAGDFNAQPHDAPMRLLQDSGRFSGAFEGPPTFPSTKPEQRIDYILAPPGWTLVDYAVIPCSASDHLPVVSTFRIGG